MNTTKTIQNVWSCHLVLIGICFILSTGCAKENISFAAVELVYSQLAEDPTTEAVLSWITNETDGHSNIFRYSKINDPAFTKITAKTKSIPERNDLQLHTVKIHNLSPGCVYQFKVGEQNIIRSFKTLPANLPSNGIKVGFAGDAHFDGKGHNLYDEFCRVMRDEEIHILAGTGDYVDCEGIIGLAQTNRWLGFLSMIDRYLCKKDDKYNYIPVVFAIGNHETDPDKGTDPDAASYLRFFFEYPNKLEPEGQNYGTIKIGDYLQLLIMDTWHTAIPGGYQKKWLKNVIDQTITHAVPIMHSTPFLTNRNPWGEVEKAIRDEWFEIFYNSENIRIAFDGHDHSWKRTVPLGINSERPVHGSNEKDKGYFTVNDNYIVRKENGIVFFGDGGWGSNSRGERYNPATTWYLEDAQDRMNIYKKGFSAADHQNDGKTAGKHWEHIFIAVFKSEDIVVQSLDPSGNVFHSYKLCYSN